MKIKPLTFKFDEGFPGIRQEKITETIIAEGIGEVGIIELYIIKGHGELKRYVDEYRGDPYSNWEPMDIFHDIEYDYDTCEIDGMIAYLKCIVIEEKYQSNQIGTKVMNQIIEHLKRENVDYFILQPSPIVERIFNQSETDEHKKKRLRLTEFYKKYFGFQKVKTINELRFPIYSLKISQNH